MAEKRGKGGKVSLDDVAETPIEMDQQLIELDLALDELAKFDPTQARVIELRYFGGMTIEETAEVMNISPATVKREWTMARAWLYRKIQ